MTVAGIFFCVANIIAFLAFVLDKLFAKWERRRIPEYVLLLLGLCGGATGGYIAMLLFRHKTRKPLFYVFVPLMMVAQLYLFIRWRFF